MKNQSLIKSGIIGTVLMVVCCFTPFLVLVLGAVGLSAWLGWLDYVLLPMLAVSVGVLAYGLYQRRQRGRESR